VFLTHIIINVSGCSVQRDLFTLVQCFSTTNKYNVRNRWSV